MATFLFWVEFSAVIQNTTGHILHRSWPERSVMALSVSYVALHITSSRLGFATWIFCAASSHGSYDKVHQGSKITCVLKLWNIEHSFSTQSWNTHGSMTMRRFSPKQYIDILEHFAGKDHPQNGHLHLLSSPRCGVAWCFYRIKLLWKGPALSVLHIVSSCCELNWLVVSTPLKNISQLGLFFQYLEKHVGIILPNIWTK